MIRKKVVISELRINLSMLKGLIAAAELQQKMFGYDVQVLEPK